MTTPRRITITDARISIPFQPCQRYCTLREVSDVDDEVLVVGVFVVESNCGGMVEDTTTGLEVVDRVVLTVDDVAIGVETVEDLVVVDASGPIMLMVIVFWKEVIVPVSG